MTQIRLQKQVYYWLLTGAVLVALMVVIGGITRLTQSGLSMVEWKPVTGIIPPLSEADWQSEFELYQQSPEFKHFNYDFSLSEYKQIYFWEYIHRVVARLLGLIFIIPFVWFWVKKAFPKKLKPRLWIIFALGLGQGVMGWLMVKSGLVDNPHVSHYRLMMHLMFAVALVLYIYHTALWVKYSYPEKKVESRLKKATILLFILTLLQVSYGALVAGLKAGFLYNNFPKMGPNWLPATASYNFPDMGMMILFEDGGTVQFIHRIIAFLVLFAAIAYWKRFGEERFPKWILVTILLQVILGIITLMTFVPVSLGVLHQIVAIFILLLIVRQLFDANYHTHSEHSFEG